jgi:tRNA1Val (adenine37-N6)-methyltransferase
MPNPYFRFKQFTVFHDRCAMKVTTDACLFGAWCAREIGEMTNECPKLLDIGAGTGLLPLMIRQKNEAAIDAVEINREAAAQAKENVENSGFANISILNRDIRDFEPSLPYDVIVSNPPFYEQDLPSEDESRNTALHSHHLKLQELLQFAGKHLSPGGRFFLLMPYRRHDEVMRRLDEHDFYLQTKITVCQTPRHKPFRLMLCCSKEPASLKENEIIICNESNHYTKEFSELLGEYYLYL